MSIYDRYPIDAKRIRGALDSAIVTNVVYLAGTQTVTGAKTFSGAGPWRVTINSTGTPNSGIALQEAGVATWTLASYSSGTFTFYNESFPGEALGISATNVATFTADVVLRNANSPLRLTIDSTNGSPNAGIALKESGTAKWTLASYSGGTFTFYNEAMSAEAIGISGSTNAATFSGDVKLGTVGKGLYIKEGTNGTMGSAAMVAGTVTVSTTKVTANSRIFLTIDSPSLNIGSTYVSARTAGTSFVINSTNVLDTSTVSWLIVEPA